METLQSHFPAVHFVKAFNSVGNARMVNPEFADGKPTMFICGNNEAAKKPVYAGSVINSAGKQPTWVPSEAARAIEPLCHTVVHSRLHSTISGRTHSSC